MKTLEPVAKIRRARAALHRWGVQGPFLASAATPHNLWNCEIAHIDVPVLRKPRLQMVHSRASIKWSSQYLAILIEKGTSKYWGMFIGTHELTGMWRLRDSFALLQGRKWLVIINSPGGGGVEFSLIPKWDCRSTIWKFFTVWVTHLGIVQALKRNYKIQITKSRFFLGLCWRYSTHSFICQALGQTSGTQTFINLSLFVSFLF